MSHLRSIYTQAYNSRDSFKDRFGFKQGNTACPRTSSSFHAHLVVISSRLLSIGRGLNIQNAAPIEACRDITVKEIVELGIINCLHEAETVIIIIDG
jgi:hypothetical protein